MNRTPVLCSFLLLLLLTLLATTTVQANESDFNQAMAGLASKSRSQMKNSVRVLGQLGDVRALPALQALRDKRLRVDSEGKLYIVSDQEQLLDALSGLPASHAIEDLRIPRINNTVRRALKPVIGLLSLGADASEVRLQAAQELSMRPLEADLARVQHFLEKENDPQVRNILSLVVAQIDLQSADRTRRLQAIRAMGESAQLSFRSVLQPLVEKTEAGYNEPDAEIRAAALAALSEINHRQKIINQVGNLFYGISLGSILLLAALGLAITFGLMGVINMAHGEMLMLGAYTTYVVQNLFHSYAPQWFDFYILAALPAAFFFTAAVGMGMERTVIRYLYGRPLETLMATWGISLLLIQTIRLQFGAQNVEVANPSWLSGGVEWIQGVVFPYNRLAIIVFVIFVVILVWALLQRTRLGLSVRAVTQNRAMAASMGINTHRVDMLTFGLGSGVAGLGGVALSQIGNVGPELGQFYIVDSFMVVVLGGVGKIAGAVVGAMGLGVVNKFLEPVVGAVLGKILVLVFIILFIQKRPQGIFAFKGRAVEN